MLTRRGLLKLLGVAPAAGVVASDSDQGPLGHGLGVPIEMPGPITALHSDGNTLFIAYTDEKSGEGRIVSYRSGPD